MKVIDNTMRALENSLHYSTTKNKAISNNIANVDTPNYKAQNVSFRSMLDEASNNLNLKQTYKKHLPETNLETDNIPLKRIIIQPTIIMEIM